MTHGFAAIAERFGDVDAGNGVRGVEIGEGAGDAEHAMETARRELQLFRCLAQQGDALRVRAGNVFQQAA